MSIPPKTTNTMFWLAKCDKKCPLGLSSQAPTLVQPPFQKLPEQRGKNAQHRPRAAKAAADGADVGSHGRYHPSGSQGFVGGLDGEAKLGWMMFSILTGFWYLDGLLLLFCVWWFGVGCYHVQLQLMCYSCLLPMKPFDCRNCRTCCTLLSNCHPKRCFGGKKQCR